MHNRGLLKSLFENCPFDIIVAANGEEAITLARLHEPDILLLDYKMPKYIGLEVLRTLRKSDKFKNIPFFVITASALQQQYEVFRDEFDAFLAKPIDESELMKLMAKHLKTISGPPGVLVHPTDFSDKPADEFH